MSEPGPRHGARDDRDCAQLIDELGMLCKSMPGQEARLQPLQASALRPGAHYFAYSLALRRFDPRRLQARLSAIGISWLAPDPLAA